MTNSISVTLKRTKDTLQYLKGFLYLGSLFFCMNIILFDTNRSELFPLSLTRPSAELRLGILTIKEKWEKHLPGNYSHLTDPYLSEKYPCNFSSNNLYINGRLIPSKELIEAFQKLGTDEGIHADGELLAYRSSYKIALGELTSQKGKLFEGKVSVIKQCPDIFSYNDQEIRSDYMLLTKGKTSSPIPAGTTVIGDNVFIEEGAKISASILNSTTGPIFLAKDSEVLEGCMVRGPFALCEHAVLKMGAKIYGATTVGPHCKVGGEVNNVVFQAYSNKGHDGFLGNAVLGEWCNIGADSNNSNLKNNYEQVKIWNYSAKRFKPTGLQFCGLIMGDHSKCGINTMFNTGTVVGVSANIFGSGFPRNFVPSFSWGGAAGFTTYTLNKAFETAERVMERRNEPLTELDKNILKYIFELSAPFRVWENKN